MRSFCIVKRKFIAPGEMEPLIAAEIVDAQLLMFAAGTLGRIEDNGA